MGMTSPLAHVPWLASKVKATTVMRRSLRAHRAGARASIVDVRGKFC